METRAITFRLPLDIYENLRSEAFTTRRPMNELVAESVAARYAGKHKVIHHIDGDYRNNDPANLVLMNPEENTP